MTSQCINFSQVKLNIKHVIKNLELLKNCESHEVDIENLKTNTEHLLTHLEHMPLERFKHKLKKRQRKTLCKNVQKINQENSSLKRQTDAEASSGSISLVFLSKNKQNLNHRFRSVKESKRFLQTFELLEQLHLSRGHNSSGTYKFALKLRKLKTIWNCLLQDKLQEQTATDVTIQKQWNEVLFGPPEKTYFHDKSNFHYFIGKRQIWDSYINSKFGSSIPIGWIMPPEEINEQWRPYLASTNT